MARKFVSQVAVVCSHQVDPPTSGPPKKSHPTLGPDSHHPPKGQIMEIVEK